MGIAPELQAGRPKTTNERTRRTATTTMNCTNRDQDILLLEHGALSGMRRWATERHLRVCPRCQERREQQIRLSRLVGAAVREAGPDLRSLYGVGAVTAAAAAATTVAGAGAARMQPVRPAPLLRPAFVVGWAVAAATVAAGAWAYQVTYLAPRTEERGSNPTTIARPLPRSKMAHRAKPQTSQPAATAPAIPMPPSEDAVIIEHSRD